VTQTLVATPTEVDLSLYQGDSFTMTLTATDAANNPVNLTGTVVASLATAPGQAAAATFTVTVVTNVATLSLTPAATNLLAGLYVWDCQWTDATGKVTTLAMGAVQVLVDVT
jgi:hypothetical protein